MEDDKSTFGWHDFKFREKVEGSGRFTFEQIQPLLQRVARTSSYLVMCLSGINLDFTALSTGGIEMEINDHQGMHIATVTLVQAEEVTRKAMQDWGTNILRGKLSDLSIEWLCTSPEYA